MQRLKFYFFLLFTVFAGSIFAQQEELKKENAQVDSSVFHKVMLIPYDTRYYLSDADQDIVLQTKKDPREIRGRFHSTIDLFIQRTIEIRMPCVSLLSDTSAAAKEALGKIYSVSGYRYESPVPCGDEKEERIRRSKNAEASSFSDSKTAYRYVPPQKQNQYMAAVVTKKEIFEELFAEFGTDIFVFVNQFEIKTNYSSCLDIANKIYQREVMLHYTVYDKEGNVRAGDYAVSFFPSDSNHADDIIHDCFPQIAGDIARCSW